MFTGIVEELGEVRAVEPAAVATRLVFEAPLVASDAAVGDSIAVDGTCLTVVDTGPGWWAAQAVPETLGRTTLGRLRPGDPVNLERPVRPDSRLGGHLVQGHVDGVGEIVAPAPDLVVRVPAGLVRYLVPKGSVTVDGCSLTVVDVTADAFSVAVIPHTAAVTTLGRKTAGDAVNLEADVIAKYVERLLGAGAVTPYGGLG
ncbi:riboflavin synthase [Acidimicrobiaceae bacterium USS-CC1]|uniref:Riboflavin synthase n=1 Tax=Acidiferrimicrobium australe TaxID=2664430 RepID=A0ABW9QY08_9ACTN|nr:riboflavin synthase [Acidiferrimicrobium australe]HET9071910.1 riboflavin synthase [Acidimicrobiales bacterium]